MENFALAMSRFKRNKFDDCIFLCDEMLKINDKDLAVLMLKSHAIRKKNYIDDLEIDDEALGDKILDDHKILNNAKPGTSFGRPGSKGNNQAVKPMSSSGRPLSGVMRPNSRSMNQSRGDNRNLISRSGNSNRLVSSGGRNMRIATASLQAINSSMGLDINMDKIPDLVKKKPLAKVSKM